MADRSWSLQDAKAQFSALVEAATRGNAQHVTRHGRAAVVIVGADEFSRLRRAELSAAPGFIEHLIAVPRQRSPSRSSGAAPETTRAVLRPREIDLS